MQEKVSLGSPASSIANDRKSAKILEDAGFKTVEDLLYYLPSRYIEPCSIFSLSNLREGEKACILGHFGEPEITYLGDKTYCTARFIEEGSGKSVECMFFAAKSSYRHFLLRFLRSAGLSAVEGKPSAFGRRLRIIHPQITPLSGEEEAREFCREAARPHAVYRSSHGAAGEKLAKLISAALAAADIPDILPPSLISSYGLFGRREAFRALHKPNTIEEAKRARKTFKMEEALISQGALLKMRRESAGNRAAPILAGSGLDEVLEKSLPFSLTPSQKKALSEIKGEMAEQAPMKKLLEGDVGTGKTIVALLAMLRCVSAGRQAVMVAPTVVLAWQHYKNFKKLLSLLGLAAPELYFLSGALKKGEKDKVRQAASEGRPCLVVATHSAFYSFSPKNLGLLVIDEQHRFGVMQRGRFSDGGLSPHVLSMSATPIPRSLAMAFFSDLSISRLEPRKEQSASRTVLLEEGESENMARLFWHCRREIDAGKRVFVICPAVKGGEKMHSVDEIASRLSALPQFRGVPIASLTGQDSAAEKEEAMGAFASGARPLLVSTSVVETGVDVAQASCMVIFDANRFGLSQLHQFRGRVGRDGTPSWTFLISREPEEDAQARLEVMRDFSTGREVSKFDVENRGEGDVLGEGQAGKFSSFKFLSVIKDSDVIRAAKAEAEKLDFSSFPALKEKCAEFLEKYQSFLIRF
ncbi:MAG: DEAD/DEAH box helicase [Aeriscardovia sp.]|nr:DEAD/DEAH box helicase [Aeriscardovia sp.]